MNRLDAVILFQPSGEELQSATKMLAAFPGSGVIWDNTPDDAGRHTIRTACEASGVEYHSAGLNLGTSGALNRLLLLGRERGADWLHYLDQDSTPTSDYVARLAMADTLPRDAAALGCMHVLPHEDAPACSDAGIAEARALITSGTMYRISALLGVGGFDETMFLDTVDHEVCFRLRSSGYRVFLDPERLMTHTIGERTFHVGGAEFSWHTPWRRRRMWRNSVWLSRRYARRFPSELARHWIARVASTGISAVRYRDPSFAQQAVLGLKDGVTSPGARQGVCLSATSEDRDILLSIVIPVKNGATTIDRAIRSCALDRFDNVETWVIENGSTDETRSLLDSLSHERLRIAVVPPRGRSAARNRGLELANGQYVLFLDADDELCPAGLEALLETLVTDHPAAALGAIRIQDPMGNATVVPPTTSLLHEHLLVLNRLPINSVALRRDLCTTFPEGVEHCEDWRFWLESLRGVTDFATVPQVIGTVHQHGSNTSADLVTMKSFEIPVYLDYLDERLPISLTLRRMLLLRLALVVYSGGPLLPAVEGRLSAAPSARLTVRLFRKVPAARGIARRALRVLLPHAEVLQ